MPSSVTVLAVALHRQLLEVGGKPLQVLVVRQDGDRLGAEEVGVPDGQEPQEDRQVALERGRPEVLVHRVEAGEHRAELPGADRDHRREADGRVHRVATADPVPELEHVRGVDAELVHLLGVRRDGDEVLGDRRLVPQGAQAPGARRAGVGHRLEGREGLRRDDEQRLRRVEVAGGLGEVGAVDVGDEPEGQAPVAVEPEGLVGHHRAEVRAADADVDDVADALAGMTRPRAPSHPVGELGHPVEHGVNGRHHVLAVDEDRLPLRGAKSHVQDGALLGDVDLLPPEHGVDAGPQARLLGQLKE